MLKAEHQTPYKIRVPPGTELNYGYHEDSDSVITTVPTDLLVIETRRNGHYL